MTIRVGGYGPGGCDCSIHSVAGCPVHGTKARRLVKAELVEILTGIEALRNRIVALREPQRNLKLAEDQLYTAELLVRASVNENEMGR